jgi:hypothetical protein
MNARTIDVNGQGFLTVRGAVQRLPLSASDDRAFWRTTD